MLKITDSSLYRSLAAVQESNSAELKLSEMTESITKAIGTRPPMDMEPFAPLVEKQLALVEAINEKNAAPDLDPLIQALSNGMRSIVLALMTRSTTPRTVRFQRENDKIVSATVE